MSGEPMDDMPEALQLADEHTPLDYYKYGEYPRFIRPVGTFQFYGVVK